MEYFWALKCYSSKHLLYWKYFRYGSKQMAIQLCLQKGQGSFHEPTAREEQAPVSSSRSLPFCRRSCSGSSPQGPQVPRCQGQQVLGPCLPLVAGAVETRTEVRATPGCREHVKDTQWRNKDNMGEPHSGLQLQWHPTKTRGQATASRAEQKAHRGRLVRQWQHHPSALCSPGRVQSKQLCSFLLITQPASSRPTTRLNCPLKAHGKRCLISARSCQAPAKDICFKKIIWSQCRDDALHPTSNAAF